MYSGLIKYNGKKCIVGKPKLGNSNMYIVHTTHLSLELSCLHGQEFNALRLQTWYNINGTQHF